LNISAKKFHKKIDPYNFELYRFKVGAFLRHYAYDNKKAVL